MYVILGRTSHSNLYQYELGDIYTLESLPMTYRSNELKPVTASHLKLCFEMERNVDNVIKKYVAQNEEIIVYKVKNYNLHVQTRKSDFMKLNSN